MGIGETRPPRYIPKQGHIKDARGQEGRDITKSVFQLWYVTSPNNMHSIHAQQTVNTLQCSESASILGDDAVPEHVCQTKQFLGARLTHIHPSSENCTLSCLLLEKFRQR